MPKTDFRVEKRSGVFAPAAERRTRLIRSLHEQSRFLSSNGLQVQVLALREKTRNGGEILRSANILTLAVLQVILRNSMSNSSKVRPIFLKSASRLRIFLQAAG